MHIRELLEANELHMAQLLRTRLDDIGLPPDATRILKGKGIYTLRELTSLTRAQLLGIKFLGRANVQAIERLLKTMDLKLRQPS